MSNESVKEAIKEMMIEQTNGEESPKAIRGIFNHWLGKYVICRSRNEGVNFGKVEQLDASGVELSECRRLWYHKPIKGSWYEAVAEHGLADESELSAAVSKLIIEDYSLTECNEAAAAQISSMKSHEGAN